MPLITSKDGLKSFLMNSRLLTPADWDKVAADVASQQDVEGVVKVLERRQFLTQFQAGRILKGETEGLVLGRYKLQYRNASGGFARVFRAVSIGDNKVVALKLLRDRWADDPRTVASFVREAQICQQFVHPNVVPIYEIGNEGRFHYFSMEFVEGGNLRDFMKIRKTLSPQEATRCMLQVFQGLEYALSKGVTHRDLKLTNVLMSSNGVAKLVDFGLAGADTPDKAGTSEDNQRALEYSVLERGTNAPRNDPRSDIFFAGSIYYELLTGEGPWSRSTDRDERQQLNRYTKIQPLRNVLPNLNSSIVAACNRMMEVSPSARYQSPTEAIHDLRRIMVAIGDSAQGPTAGDQKKTMDLGKIKPLTMEMKPEFRLIVVDSLEKRCRIVADYFEKHGFDLTFVASPQIALEKLKAEPPDGILFLADNDPESVLAMHKQIQAYARNQNVPCLAVFATDDERAVNEKVVPTRFFATIFQPATLRDIRTHFEEIGAATR